MTQPYITGLIRRVLAQDTSSNTGEGKAGLEFDDITASYGTDVAADIALTTEDIATLGVYQAPTDATHIRIKRISDSGSFKGQLEIHFHNNQLINASATMLWLTLSADGAMIPPLGVELSPAPTVVQIRTDLDSFSNRLANIDLKTMNLPIDPADQSLIIAATDALATAIGTRASASALSTLSTQVGSPMQAGAHVQLATTQDQYAPSTAAALASLVTTVGAAGAGLTAVGLADSEDVYHARINLCIDQANTQDEYTAIWLKNGVRVTSGITVPTLQLIKRVDGTNLLAATAMTQIGTTGAYKYDATGANRQTAGEAVLAVVSATIDGSTRTFPDIPARDST